MYLVMRMATRFGTNMGDVDITTDSEVCGFCYVYRRKKDAVKAAKGSAVMKIETTDAEIET